MIKKLSVLALASCLVMPLAAIAGDLEDRVEELETQLEEQGEAWDLAARIQFSGDIRNRADFAHTADTAKYYKATDLATGAQVFVDAYPTFNAMANNAATDTIAEVLAAMGPSMGSEAAFIAAWGPTTGGGNGSFTSAQASAVYFMFTDPAVGAMMTAMAGAGAPTSTLSNAMSSYENLIGFMKGLPASSRKAIFDNMGYTATLATKYENDSMYSTRLRLNMRAKATENIEVKVRLVGYKIWGMQDMPENMSETNEDGVHDTNSPYYLNGRSFDGTASRQPSDNKLAIDRAFMNWNNIAGLPMWFSVGRRPTTDGPPAQLRMGADKRMATPVNYMDYPFDGASMGYAYSLPMDMDGSGRFRICYGRGFESGPSQTDTGMNDVDFAGFSWDVMKSGARFINLQSFAALNLFNVPGDTYFPNPFEMAQKASYEAGQTAAAQNDFAATGMTDAQIAGQYASSAPANTYLDRKNMGNVYHTSAVYMDEIGGINYFGTLGWSRSDAKGVDELGVSLLADNWAAPETKDGYGVYIGGRYDLDDLGLKLGLEYNWGSENWLAFTPGHDDMYSSKLQTRGSVYEAYLIYDLPSGEAISKFGKAFMRLGYQYYDYEYTYSGMWLGTPNKIDDIKNDPMMAQFYAPIDKMQQVYLTLEAYF